ncbi:MAG: flippase-like domain-containing protein [Proteobacteria bacterium]|nr:flippase-like domain-containing protein [Pseudomonadota bacterium]
MTESEPARDAIGIEPGRRTSRFPRLARLGPWLVAAGILAFVLARVPIDDFTAALSRVSAWRLIALSVGFVFAMLAADSLAVWLAVRAALTESRLSYGAVLRIRGTSYLLALVNYAAGQGGVVYLMHRHYNLPVSAGTGAVLLATSAFLVAVALAVGFGLLSGAIPDRTEINVAAIGLLAAAAAYLIIVKWRPAVLARSRWLAPFFTAGIWGTLRVIAARTVHLTVLLAGHITAMLLFGIEVPISVAAAGLPVLFFVATLPISPAGLGTTQAAAVTLFASFAPGANDSAQQAAVLAYSLAFQIAGTLVAAVVGVVCLRSLQAAREDG